MTMRSRKGFTLIELLVVMVIISLLAAMLLPAIGDVRRRSVMLKCMSNMKSIGEAMHAWVVATNYQPVMPTSPVQALTYFQGHTWDQNAHNFLYCWTEDGSDGPHKARAIVNILYPSYLRVGEVFYCPSFNRMTKQDLGGSTSEPVTYDNSWNKDQTDWWGYEWVNPRWPVTNTWVAERYPIGSITKAATPDTVMFCHYSLDHAGYMRADASVEAGRHWLEGDVPFGW